MLSDKELTKLGEFERGYDPATHLVNGAMVGPSLEYARLLLDRRQEGDVGRAAETIETVLALQGTDESAAGFGQFPWQVGGPVGDFNIVLFLMPHLVAAAERGEALPAETRQRLETAIRQGAVGAERRWDTEVFDLHRDFVKYTNPFLLYVQALLLAGRHCKDDRLLRKALGQWRRWFIHIAYTGIDEFVSQTYTTVDAEALRRIHERAVDERMRHESGMALDHLMTLLHAVTHPLLKVPICGSARDYRLFLKTSDCQPAGIGQDDCTAPAEVVREYKHRTFPHLARGRATSIPFHFTSWQMANAGLGSMSGGNYFWQQIHCMAAAGASATQRAVLFLPGSYTTTGGYVRQAENRALCIFSRLPVSYYSTQAAVLEEQVPAAMRDYGIGVTTGWEIRDDASIGRWVFSAYGHDVTIDPFMVQGDRIVPAPLNRVHRDTLSQGKFHRTAAELDEYIFPADALWFGCVVSLTQAGAAVPAPAVTFAQDGQHVAFSTGASPERALTVRIFRHPTGELTELYESDWRTWPLLQAPSGTVWPGELTRRSADEQARRT